MERSNVPKSKLYPHLFKKIILSFSEPELYGVYVFPIYKIQLPSFKHAVKAAGGELYFEDGRVLHYCFEGEGCVLTVHDLALPHMYKH